VANQTLPSHETKQITVTLKNKDIRIGRIKQFKSNLRGAIVNQGKTKKTSIDSLDRKLENSISQSMMQSVKENPTIENSVDLVKHEDNNSSMLGMSLANTLTPYNLKKEHHSITPYKI
jgi:hypothetical protein